MALIREMTEIPVSRIFGHKVDDNNSIGSAFILMEYLHGSVVTDMGRAAGSPWAQVPLGQRQSFFSAIARIQVQMTSLRFPRIGMVFKTLTGYEIGPMPGLGGPFDTAREFITAWSATTHFPNLEKKLMSIPCESLRAELHHSIKDFPGKLLAAANRVVLHNSGPFPLCHTDFFHSNVMVDQDFRVQGVIDWEGACTLPWELVELPTFLETVPQRFDAPQNYDQDGQPKDEETRQRWKEREEYIALVGQMERKEDGDQRLSSALGSVSLQEVAYAMRVYTDPGKLGFYNRILE